MNPDGDARQLLMIVLLFFVGGGIWLGWKVYDDVQQFQHRAILRTDGREVVGEVTGLSYPRGGPTKVKYRFTVRGVTYADSAAEPGILGSGPSLHKSDQIFIRFLPSNPAINHPDAWEWSPSIGIVPVAFQVFFFGMGTLLLVMLLRDRNLARKGKAASATVTSCTRGDKSFCIKYEFRTEDGIPIPGKSDRAEEQKVGARIWILYLPKRPRRNEIYPLSDFDVAG
jgi:hypothetical protein